jgi:transposase-like protein
VTKSKPNRKKYSEEFRTQAVNLFLTQNRPATEVAKELGVQAHLLRVWIRQANAPNASSAGTKTVLDELAQLKKDFKTLKMENEILKKAATYFAKNLS